MGSVALAPPGSCAQYHNAKSLMLMTAKNI
jgi:hypothetical protein